MGNPTVTPLQEQWHDGGFIVSEANGHISRETVTLTGGAKVLAGTVLGQQTTGNTAAAAALGANTGNGTFGAITVAAPAQAGDYVVQFADATHFVVEDPQGIEVGHGTTGTAFNGGGLGFTITAGSTAFAAGDSFKVTVAAGSKKYAPLSLTAADGTGVPAAVLYGTKDVTAVDKLALVMARHAELNGSELIWPPGATANQITAFSAQLAKDKALLVR
ncbi:head decoration protein [Herbaspirillum seropedicae]|uniref:head decoration protein n=1 Tax=Herbaspirillum seropedicae TaxID=964 RepID=UPI00111D6493|nr:head decoration protein [Herbaspirillum seropedicae]QDD65541.1 head decoration protein [Herbaspirillum seropedicae]